MQTEIGERKGSRCRTKGWVLRRMYLVHGYIRRKRRRQLRRPLARHSQRAEVGEEGAAAALLQRHGQQLDGRTQQQREADAQRAQLLHATHRSVAAGE